MIKFTCDACGKDISEKIHCSIRQFYPIDHFKKRPPEVVGLGAMHKHVPEGCSAAEHKAHRVYYDVKLLDEFSKVMHAHAWEISSARIHCSKCAVKDGHRKKGRVMTIFTRIEGRLDGESVSADSPRPS
ncbi:MAG: hypothetical protein JRJ47_06650 [Deltaproteobacteria bacterium]|nr:hypothetical protein [Deltaproteobacteria bacterium]